MNVTRIFRDIIIAIITLISSFIVLQSIKVLGDETAPSSTVTTPIPQSYKTTEYLQPATPPKDLQGTNPVLQ